MSGSRNQRQWSCLGASGKARTAAQSSRDTAVRSRGTDDVRVGGVSPHQPSLIRDEQLEAQADALGLPLTKVYLPLGKITSCTNHDSEEIMARGMADFRSRGICVIRLSDLVLEDLRAWPEAAWPRRGSRASFSILRPGNRQLSRQIIAMGYKAILSS